VNLIDRSIYYEPAIGELINNKITIINAPDATMLNQESAISTSAIYSSGEYYAVFQQGSKRVIPAEFVIKVNSAANLQISRAALLAMFLALFALF